MYTIPKQTKVVGSLEEIGAEVGDIVEHLYNGITGRSVDVGQVYRVILREGVECVDGRDNHKGHKFRIVTSAKPKPTVWKQTSPEEKGKILLALHEGRQIQQFIRGNTGHSYWVDVSRVCDEDCIYRVRPDRVISEWSGWALSDINGSIPVENYADIQKVHLPDSGEQFAYRVRLFV